MRQIVFGIVASAAMVLPCAASSLSVAGLIDGEDGRSVDLDGRVDLTEQWSLGAGFGYGESDLGDQHFSARSLRASTDLQLGAFFVGASADRWHDSGQLRATTLRGELGWMSDSGLAVSALVTDRNLDITYIATLEDQTTREFDIAFRGTGYGAGLSYFGDLWNAGIRFLDYTYGNNVARLQAVLSSAGTERFPRLQRLTESVATRAAGTPDRELTLVLGRQFARSHLSADWHWRRDALTGEKTTSAGLTLGLELGRQLLLDTMLGISDGGAAGSVPWGGLALTITR
jgi:hypothetical protein